MTQPQDSWSPSIYIFNPFQDLLLSVIDPDDMGTSVEVVGISFPVDELYCYDPLLT